MKTLDVNVLGQRVPVKGENAQKIREYADYLDAYLRELSHNIGVIEQKTLHIVAGLNLVETIFYLKKKTKDLRKSWKK